MTDDVSALTERAKKLNRRVAAHFNRGERVVCAVSGGADSVALLLALKALDREGFIELSAAHLEHGIRGCASRGDAAFVSSLCERLEIPLTLESVDVPAIASKTGQGLELAAREERYRFLRRVKTERGADVIALAHHADDQAETVLMHLFRGSGLRGLGGMRRRSGDLVRPLLTVRKSELTDYVLFLGFSWREDATNGHADTPRNALRLEVLPTVESIYPGAVKAIGRCADILSREERYLFDQTSKWLAGHAVITEGLSFFELLHSPHEAILGRAIQRAAPHLEAQDIDAALDLAGRAKGSVVLSGGYTACRTGQRLYLMPPDVAPVQEIAPLKDGAALRGIGSIRMRSCLPTPVRNDTYRQVLRASALKGAVLRTRRTGDVIHPLGAPGRKKLKDYFIDKKVDRPLRDWLPLVARDSEILWAPGIGISERARVEDGVEAVELIFQGNKWLHGGMKNGHDA